MPERRPGLVAQLLLAGGAMVVATAVAVAVASRYGARTEFGRFQAIERRAIADRGASIAPRLAGQLDGRCCDPGDLESAGALLGADLALFVLEEGSGRLAGAAGGPLAALHDVRVGRDGREIAIAAVRSMEAGRTELLELRVLSDGTPIALSDGRRAAIYVLPLPSVQRERAAAAALGALDRRLVLVTAIVGVVALAAMWVIARRTVGPIAALRAATRDLASGRAARRVEPGGSREVADLAAAFNTMAGELERQRTLRRALVTDVAHELRTPLTAAQCRLEMVQDGVAPEPSAALRQVHEEIRHLAHLVDDLQDLALAEAGELRLDLADVALAPVVVSALGAAALDADPRVSVAVPVTLCARSDARRLRQMLVNLLTNAERYTPGGGAIVIRAGAQAGEVGIEVTNTGSHLAPAELERLFDRFYRTDPSRQRVTGGSGLGLAIVKHLAEAQGGRAWAASHDGSVTVGFTLPLGGARGSTDADMSVTGPGQGPLEER